MAAVIWLAVILAYAWSVWQLGRMGRAPHPWLDAAGRHAPDGARIDVGPRMRVGASAEPLDRMSGSAS